MMKWSEILVASLSVFWFIVRQMGFPGGASGKKPACQCRRCKRCRFDAWQEDPLEKGMATHSSILAWRIPWIEESAGLQSMGSQRVGCYEATNTHRHTNTHTKHTNLPQWVNICPASMLSCFSRVQFCATSWTIACQTPLSMGFSRQPYWSRMPVPVPGDPCNPGMEPRFPALKADSLLSESPGKLLLLTVSKGWLWILFWKCGLH